jgi:hypothetical protein
MSRSRNRKLFIVSLPSAPSDRADGAVGKIRKNVMVSQPLAAEQHLRWLQSVASKPTRGFRLRKFEASRATAAASSRG